MIRTLLYGEKRLRGVAFAIAALLGAIFLLDLLTPRGVADAIPYVIPVILATWLQQRRAFLLVAIVCSVLTALGFFFSPPGAGLWLALSNRVLALLAIWAVALICLKRHAVEAALHESREHLRSLSESAPVGIFETDSEGRCVYTNPRWQELTGLTQEEARGEGWVRALHPEDRNGVVAEWQRCVRENREFSREVRLQTPAGETRWVYAMASTLQAPERRVRGFVGTVEDVTERRRLEQQLQMAQKMEAVGLLAGGLAHDFNNLLNVIIGYSDLLLDSLRTDGASSRKVEEIRKAGQRAAALTRQLLAFGRKQVLQPQVLNLNAIVPEVQKMLGRLIGEDIELTYLPAAGLGNVVADPGQLEQVILNLAINARDAMPNGGRLTLETAEVCLDEDYGRLHPDVRPGPYVMLAVTDTGTGMDKATQARIFEPFFTTKEKGKGTGLGLATVYGIVKQSGGHIAVYSEPGHGTSFKLCFPRTEERAGTAVLPERATLPAPPRAEATVLLVEDEPSLRALTSESLRNLGYIVMEAATAADALRISREHAGAISLLVTDVVIPGKNGRALAEELSKQRPGIKVLYVSGYPDETISKHGVLERGTHFLQKPFTRTALSQALSAVLQG